MPPTTSCKEAIRRWQEREGKTPAEAEQVKLFAQIPPLGNMGEELNQFENCTWLSLSTNAIERMGPLGKLRSLKILSLSRNNIKRIAALEEIGATLE